jgi:methionyl aminopeptidase
VHAEKNGYSVVREYCGHGIGKKMHEDSQVVHYGKPGQGIKLRPGMTFTIEPMINQGRAAIKTVTKNNWTVAVTADRRLSAQWEHTLLVTETGYEVLTLREEERESFNQYCQQSIPA